MNEQELILWVEDWITQYHESSGECESASLRMCWHLQPYTLPLKTTLVAATKFHTIVLFNSEYWIDNQSRCIFNINFTEVIKLNNFKNHLYRRFWSEGLSKEYRTFKYIRVKEYETFKFKEML
ncbi:hypothetical protein OAV13_00455 [bacterium]|nr:hypothetical protein [bacterium]